MRRRETLPLATAVTAMLLALATPTCTAAAPVPTLPAPQLPYDTEYPTIPYTTGEPSDPVAALARWEPGQLDLGRNLLERTREMGDRSQFRHTWIPGDPSLRLGLYGPGR